MTPAAGWCGASMSIHEYQHRKSLARRSSSTMAQLSARLVVRPVVLLVVARPGAASHDPARGAARVSPKEPSRSRPAVRPGWPVSGTKTTSMVLVHHNRSAGQKVQQCDSDGPSIRLVARPVYPGQQRSAIRVSGLEGQAAQGPGAVIGPPACCAGHASESPKKPRCSRTVTSMWGAAVQLQFLSLSLSLSPYLSRSLSCSLHLHLSHPVADPLGLQVQQFQAGGSELTSSRLQLAWYPY
jgi:hypothetical protein